ncbi:MAG TPA: arabinogalactan endo-1,4-beta-galactosidase [Anaerolineae bacterium]|nr:arabinogalactan endo-1,4-beta-galactosidase [Anaerolineae bacterium]HQK14011.1 arabinogalactan endo-1,4-beta-galactosidase [Anaerolineae bacterium]
MAPAESTATLSVEVQATSEEQEMVFATSNVVQPAHALAMRGVDISSLPQVEDKGGVFYNTDGQAQDIFEILADHGVNYVRLKLWHTPANGYNNLEKVKGMAIRIKRAGMGFLLDFHYSDTWADPKKQYKPLAWWDYDYEQLRTAVYEYTKEAVTALREQNTAPDIVQIGNEIPGGMLWDQGKLNGSADQFSRLAGLLKAGIAGVKDAGCDAKIMLHLDRGGDNALYRWWFDNIIAEGVEFDIIGLSFYGYWHGDLRDLAANLADLAQRYNKELIVVETAYAYTLDNQDGYGNIIAREDQLIPGYPATVEGQSAWLRDLMQVVKDVPGGLAKGVFYWEPAWLGLKGCGWNPADPQSGNAWENQALFDFGGHVLPSLAVFREFSE